MLYIMKDYVLLGRSNTMERKKVWAVYFSATDTTKKTVLTIADEAARLLGAEREDYDFTLPRMRENGFAAGKDDLVIFGTPVYAGRVPNVLLKYLATIQGNGALAVPVVLFGNRNFDDGLIELRDILENTGFHTVAAAAFVGEHSFSKTLAAGRPDADDMKEALASGTVAAYVVDFPTEDILGVENVIAIPHLGASTPESEDNCAVMAADELIAFLEDGNIVNSVNFPTVEVPRTTERRICVLHKNVPNMLSQISGVVSAAGINIETMVNKSKKDNAYTVLDVEGDPDEAALEKILAIDGVIRVRKI